MTRSEYHFFSSTRAAVVVSISSFLISFGFGSGRPQALPLRFVNEIEQQVAAPVHQEDDESEYGGGDQNHDGAFSQLGERGPRHVFYQFLVTLLQIQRYPIHCQFLFVVARPEIWKPKQNLSKKFVGPKAADELEPCPKHKNDGTSGV